MNKLTGTFIFILLSFCTLGSNFKADSISSLLNSTTDPRTTANLKIELAWIKKYEDLKLSTKTTLENLKQLNQLNDDEGVAIATSYLGVYYYLDNKLPEAVIQLKIAEEYFEREQNVDRLCRVYNNLGVCYGSLYNYIEALSYYNKVLDLKNQLPQVHDISSNLINIASIYYNQGDYNQCINYYEQALVLTIANKNHESTAIVYSNLGASYERLGNYPESINYALKALEVYQNKTENKLAIIRTYSNLGSTYMSLNKLEEARHYYNRSSELNKEANSEGQQIVILNNLAELERLSGNYKQAKTHALKGLSLSIATNNSEEELISLNTLSNIENDLQDYKSSLWYYKEYIQLSDSLLEISNYQKTQLALDQNQLIT
ncbi:MAG: tetratricopeptide repeat protein, partial [Salibacteraceae bacterium]